MEPSFSCDTLSLSLSFSLSLYLLRTAPCFLSSCLQSYDELLCSIISRICNVNLSVSDAAWLQSSLPVRSGGLGLRSAVQLAPSAFLASAAASVELMAKILPVSFCATVCEADLALSHWYGLFPDGSPAPPPGDDAKFQRARDSPCVVSSLEHLLSDVSDETTKARLLSVSTPESGAWLHALPVANLGLKMDDSTIQVSVGLRLGLPLSRPHLCGHCGALVDKFATHPLSCRQSGGRFHRHATVNVIIQQAFTAAAIPVRLEPAGLSRSDGKRPDGVTIVPWECGRCAVWDFTCPDTLAPSYRSAAASDPGAVAALAESRKMSKYSALDSTLYRFFPIAIETMGAFGSRSLRFIKNLGRRITLHSGDPLATCHFVQRLSVAIQQGNAASILLSN